MVPLHRGAAEFKRPKPSGAGSGKLTLVRGLIICSVLFLLLQPDAALPSEVPESILECSKVAAEVERLACYDAAVAAAAAAASDRSRALFSLDGQNDGDSVTFRAPARWYVEWTSEGSIITVELHTTGGAFEAVVGTQIGGGSGRSRSFGSGSYRLAVRGVGSWELRAYLEQAE